MLTKQLARDLLPLVNGEDYQSFQDLLTEIEQDCLKKISYEASEITVRHIQGQLQLVKYLRALRERVLQEAK